MIFAIDDNRRSALRPARTGAALAFAYVALVSTPVIADDDCEKREGGWSVILACMSQKKETELKKTYEDTLRHVRSKDPNAARLLIKAQASWWKFLNDSCDYTAAARPDEISEDARYNCVVDFIEVRINVLKSYKSRYGKTDR